MKQFLTREWMLLLMILLPLPLMAYLWPQIGETIVIHYDFSGKPDGHGPKLMLFVFPLLNAAISVMLMLLPVVDPRKENYQNFERAYRMIRLALAAFLSYLCILTTLDGAGFPIDFLQHLCIAMLLLFAILGNFITTVQPNYLVGVRTPWTLDDPVVWKKTHQATGRLWFIGSIALIVLTLLLPRPWLPYLFLAGLSIQVLFPVLHSFLIFRKLRA